MENLNRYHLVPVIHEIVEKGTPFLGICLGLQILFERSEESPGVEGLGLLKGEILRIPDKEGLKIPHMGWNSIHLQNEGRLFKGISQESYVYFVHSYYLKAEEEDGITVSPMYERLQTLSSPMAMVAQAQALPEKFVAPFTLGAPKDTDPSQVVIAADMEVKDGILQIQGETFSFNETIDKALQKAVQNYRPIKGSYVKSMPDDALAGIFMNVNGEQFLPMMQSNRSLQTLLMGINQAVDMDNIMRSVDGDMAIVLPTLGDADLKMMMAAKLAHSKWLGDVDYWKTSCPAGAKIANWGKNSYFYTDGKTSFYFGVTDDKQFFSGSDELTAQYAVKPSNHPIDAKIQKLIVGQKLAMVINLAKSSDGSGTGKDDAISTVTGLLAPVFGNLTSVVYTLK